jgi:hypothetical protein
LLSANYSLSLVVMSCFQRITLWVSWSPPTDAIWPIFGHLFVTCYLT